MKDAVKSTYTSIRSGGHRFFGGLFDASALKEMKSLCLVASTDGVGTKVKLAASVGRYRGIGHDIVNHCINDILVQGARPLFFMDYFATSKLESRTNCRSGDRYCRSLQGIRHGVARRRDCRNAWRVSAKRIRCGWNDCRRGGTRLTSCRAQISEQAMF